MVGHCTSTYGTKIVDFGTFGDHPSRVKFHVSDVKRAILSVGLLKRESHDVDFCTYERAKAAGLRPRNS